MSASAAAAEKKTKKKKKVAEAEPELLVLVLAFGIDAGDAAAVLEALKSQSKSISSHKGRQLYWEAYSKFISRTSSMEGSANCFLRFTAVPGKEAEGTVEVINLTKRQRGLLNSGLDVMGKKHKSPENPQPRAFVMTWGEDGEAQRAWEDLQNAEPCIYVAADGVYVGTRLKRLQCKALSNAPKTVKDAEALVASLAPDAPLRSINFNGTSSPPACNGYNTFMTCAGKLAAELPANIGYIGATSCEEIYDYFSARRNEHLVAEAGKLIGQMIADVNKGLQPLIVAASTKDAAVAYKCGLMKRVYVHESFDKFINVAKRDGAVEVWVVRGNVDESEFGRHGKIVFELFYRCDLSTMM